MKRFCYVCLGAVVMILASGQAIAQPPENDRSDRVDGRRDRIARMMRKLPVMAALDADENGEISTEEMEQAVVALKKLDENQDGKLTVEELRPRPAQGGPDEEGRPREGRREGPPWRGPEGPEGIDGPRPPRPFRPEGRPGPDGPDGPREPSPEEFDGPEPFDGPRPPHPDGPPSGPPSDEAGGREGRRFGQRGPFGPPPPEELVARFMEHDADQDGKLSREELLKAAQAMGRGAGRGGR